MPAEIEYRRCWVVVNVDEKPSRCVVSVHVSKANMELSELDIIRKEKELLKSEGLMPEITESYHVEEARIVEH